MKLKLLACATTVIAISVNAEIKREDYPSYGAYIEAVKEYNANYSAQRYEKPATAPPWVVESERAAVDDTPKEGAEIKYERNQIWVFHKFESRATCEVYIDGELAGRQKRVPNWVPYVYQHDSSLRDVGSWEGSCKVVPHVSRSGVGKAVDYSKEAASADHDREREEWLIRQGSTLSKKFEVHESAQPKSRSSVIFNSRAASQKTYSVRSRNGSGSITYGGFYTSSASSAGREMSAAEREKAKSGAAERYREALESGRIPPQEDLAGDEYKSELEELLNSMK